MKLLSVFLLSLAMIGIATGQVVTTSLAQPIGPGQTIVTVGSTAGILPGMVGYIEAEATFISEVRNSTQVVLVRGYNGSTPVSHPAGKTFYAALAATWAAQATPQPPDNVVTEDPITGSAAIGTTVIDGRSSLRGWDACIGNLQANSAGVCSVVYLGDSWTAIGGVTGALQSKLQAVYGSAGAGYQGLSSSQAGITTAGTWTDTKWTSSVYGLNGEQSVSIDTATPGAKSLTQTATDFVLHYLIQPGGGTFTYSVDAGAAVSLSTDPASGINLFASGVNSNGTAWNKTHLTVAADASITDPMGGTGAWKLVEDATSNERYANPTAPSLTNGLTYTISAYARAAQRSELMLVAGISGFPIAWFNLATGVAGTRNGGFSASGITPVGNGWYRCWASFTDTTATGAVSAFFGPTSADNVATYQGDGVSGIDVYGLQVNLGNLMAYADKSSTALTYATYDVSGLTNASHSIALTVTAAGTQGVTLLGAEADINVAGVRVHRVGSSGSLAAGIASVPTLQWETGLIALNPSLVVLPWGINEALGGTVSPSSQQASLVTIIQRIQAVAPNSSILLMPPIDDGATLGGSYKMADYRAAQQSLAASLGLGLFSEDKRMSYASTNQYAIWQSDMVHLTAQGWNWYANNLFKWLQSF